MRDLIAATVAKMIEKRPVFVICKLTKNMKEFRRLQLDILHYLDKLKIDTASQVGPPRKQRAAMKRLVYI
jgi:hypothetical protein